MARVDRAARVAKGQRKAAIDVAAQAGLLFQPTTPALAAATLSKDASKARCSSSTNSSSVAISSTMNVTEHHTVALVWVKRGSVGAAELLPFLPISLRGFTRFAEDGVASERLRARRSTYTAPSPSWATLCRRW
jgi:hypothetical protein